MFGHWEMDTVKGKRGVTKSCMLVLTERKTRNEIIVKLQDQKAESVVDALDRIERKWGDMFKIYSEASRWTMVWNFQIVTAWKGQQYTQERKEPFVLLSSLQ